MVLLSSPIIQNIHVLFCFIKLEGTNGKASLLLSLSERYVRLTLGLIVSYIHIQNGSTDARKGDKNTLVTLENFFVFFCVFFGSLASSSPIRTSGWVCVLVCLIYNWQECIRQSALQAIYRTYYVFPHLYDYCFFASPGRGYEEEEVDERELTCLGDEEGGERSK